MQWNLRRTQANLWRYRYKMNNPRNIFRKKAETFNLPWIFDRSSTSHVILQVKNAQSPAISDRISTIIAQIIALYPPGFVRFLLIDPVGLGQNFSSFHALSDYDDKLISSKVWSDKRQIKEQLDKLVEHIESVVQKYLRSDYATIDEYNEQAGEIAEPFRFVFIQGFPENFDSDAALALERIMANGPRCGVHVFLVWNSDKELPYGMNMDPLLQSADHFELDGNALKLVASPSIKLPSLHFRLDEPPAPEILSEIVSNHGRLAVAGAKVEVPYEKMMERIYQEDHGSLTDAKEEWGLVNQSLLAAPLGPTGARKIQQLIFGESGTTAHHALLIGKTGSGKSNLLHVLIMSLAELYPPQELQVMLVDFKKGVEFKDYATYRLPHATVVAIESEIEFGLSVLRGMDDELTRRGDLFRDAGVQDLAAYREQSGKAMPRTLLIVDEFHELFVDEGSASREALMIVERIVRQGRSFGMHLILASQSIAGIRLPRSILDQIGVRIAMQCSDADSRMVLSEDNNAARLLDRAGEAIYNDKNGLVEGNNIFQAALLSQDDRITRLNALREKALAAYPDNPGIVSGPFVFEGSEPADFVGCRALVNALEDWPQAPGSSSIKLWVGEPISMSLSHAMLLKRQSGANLLVLDRDERLGFGVIYSALMSIAAQESPDSTIIHFVDLSSADAVWADHPELFEEHFPHPLKVYARREIELLLAGVAREVASREADDGIGKPRVFLIIFGIQRARNLRNEDTFRFGGGGSGEPTVHDNLKKVLQEGPDVGVHTLIWCDTLQNAGKILDNQAMNEIGQRISGPMSASDSMKVFDDPIASKLERENRMICFDDDRVGTYSQIRPFLPCDPGWIEELGRDLNKRWLENNSG